MSFGRFWVAVLLASLAACDGTIGDANPPEVTIPEIPEGETVTHRPDIPWESLGAEIYVPRVKRLLTGLSTTPEEIARGGESREALRGLIDEWQQTPQFRDIMLHFFRSAFQQGQLKKGDLEDQFGYFGGLSAFANNAAEERRMYRDIQEMFARTALHIVEEGRPFNETLTTRGFMMTVPMMALFLHGDGLHVPDVTNDQGSQNVTFEFYQRNPDFSFVVTNEGGPIPLSETLDPESPNYMRWHAPQHDLQSPGDPTCRQDPRPYPGGYGSAARTGEHLINLLFGRLGPIASETNPNCGTMINAPVFTEEDFNTWRWVEIRQPVGDEEPTLFYDILHLRETNEIVMNTPRIGFFTTHAFFANWPTNESNLARVTMNQTLIVALGKSFDDSNSTVPISESALNGEHAEEGTVCYNCHLALDPMRQFFRQAYTLHYNPQYDEAENSVHGVFAYGGVSEQGTGIESLAEMLATHPEYPSAWTQKLCYFARSAACESSDPEFQRIAAAFQESNLDFRVLVRELFSSPIVTGAEHSLTVEEQGDVTPIAVRNQICQSLEARLEIPDVCGLSAVSPTGSQRRIRNLTEAIPAVGYSRGSEAPAIAVEPTLFLRAGMEALCSEVAAQVVDVDEASRYQSANPDAAIADLVGRIMNLHPPDARAAGAEALLREHFDSLVAADNTPSHAMTSTFVLACLSPSSIAMGI